MLWWKSSLFLSPVEKQPIIDSVFVMRIHATCEFFVKGAAAFSISAVSSDTLTVLSYFLLRVEFTFLNCDCFYVISTLSLKQTCMTLLCCKITVLWVNTAQNDRGPVSAGQKLKVSHCGFGLDLFFIQLLSKLLCFLINATQRAVEATHSDCTILLCMVWPKKMEEMWSRGAVQC